jgi:oligosaccharide reducing-end xylanase
MKKAWNAQLMTGQYRYYDGLVHYLAMLHLCGSFKIWKPTPSEEHLRELEQALNIDILGTTDINDLEADAPHADKNWYTLDGRSLHTKPTTKGIYLHENKKVMIP